MELYQRAQKLVAELPRMTARKMVDESCSLIADLLEEVDRLDTECKERVAEKMEWLGERGALKSEIERLTMQARRFYQADGSFVTLDNPEQAKELRLVAAAELAKLREENERLQSALANHPPRETE